MCCLNRAACPNHYARIIGFPGGVDPGLPRAFDFRGMQIVENAPPPGGIFSGKCPGSGENILMHCSFKTPRGPTPKSFQVGKWMLLPDPPGHNLLSNPGQMPGVGALLPGVHPQGSR